ncbi:MAG: DUF3883 domain-containing protein [Gemmatimonadaceae bacterium]|nr:DUF3883 domain-containing protein [Gloeobacterales cyanobacterium ES-bin-141]
MDQETLQQYLQNGNAFVVDKGAIIITRERSPGLNKPGPTLHVLSKQRVERIAMRAVIDAECALGCSPKDVSALKCGFDVESLDVQTGAARKIEVKGRVIGAKTVTLSRNEIETGLKYPNLWLLAVVLVEPTGESQLRYLPCPFLSSLDPHVRSVTYELEALWRVAAFPLASAGPGRVERVLRFGLSAGGYR